MEANAFTEAVSEIEPQPAVFTANYIDSGPNRYDVSRFATPRLLGDHEPSLYRDALEHQRNGLEYPNGSRVDIVSETTQRGLTQYRDYAMIVRFPHTLDNLGRHQDLLQFLQELGAVHETEKLPRQLRIIIEDGLDEDLLGLDTLGHTTTRLNMALEDLFTDCPILDGQTGTTRVRAYDWTAGLQAHINSDTRLTHERDHLGTDILTKVRSRHYRDEHFMRLLSRYENSALEPRVVEQLQSGVLERINRLNQRNQEPAAERSTEEPYTPRKTYTRTEYQLRNGVIVVREVDERGVPRGIVDQHFQHDVDESRLAELIDTQQLTPEEDIELLMALIHSFDRRPSLTDRPRHKHTPPPPFRKAVAPEQFSRYFTSATRSHVKATARVALGASKLAIVGIAATRLLGAAFNGLTDGATDGGIEIDTQILDEITEPTFFEDEPKNTPMWLITSSSSSADPSLSEYLDDQRYYRLSTHDPAGQFLSAENHPTVPAVIPDAEVPIHDVMFRSLLEQQPTTHVPVPAGYILGVLSDDGDKTYLLQRINNRPYHYKAVDFNSGDPEATYDDDSIHLLRLQSPETQPEYDTASGGQTRIDVATLLDLPHDFTPPQLIAALHERLDYSIYDHTNGDFGSADTPFERLEALVESGYSYCSSSNYTLYELLTQLDTSRRYMLVSGFYDDRFAQENGITGVTLNSEELHLWVEDEYGNIYDASPRGEFPGPKPESEGRGLYAWIGLGVLSTALFGSLGFMASGSRNLRQAREAQLFLEAGQHILNGADDSGEIPGHHIRDWQAISLGKQRLGHVLYGGNPLPIPPHALPTIPGVDPEYISQDVCDLVDAIDALGLNPQTLGLSHQQMRIMYDIRQFHDKRQAALEPEVIDVRELPIIPKQVYSSSAP